ncbi:hypothetical protein PInf_003565 [Phytophthora infestans]|nr:hypothetical protein PInf_003565 [Phytophthora infestans]
MFQAETYEEDKRTLSIASGDAQKGARVGGAPSKTGTPHSADSGDRSDTEGKGVAHLASQGPEAVTARLESFSRYENALLEHVQEKMSAATAAASMTRKESMRLKPLMVSVQISEGKDGENLLLWAREVEMDMGSALLQSEHQRVALAISRLGGRARAA